MSQSQPVLELQNVTIAFGPAEENTVFKEINLKIYPHDSIVLIGLSGSGKTVLLKTLAGLYHPKKGKVLCYGHEWDSLSTTDRHDLAAKIGMQFQKSALFDDLNTFDNVAYPLREHLKVSEAEIEARVNECLSSVGLLPAKNLMSYELSGGMKQRLGIARAIALKPEILFMDDPTSGLDPVNSDEMAQLILKLKQDIQATLIIATHDMLRAYQFAGRIFFVDNQEVLETGSAAETQKNSNPRVQQFITGSLKGPLTT